MIDDLVDLQLAKPSSFGRNVKLGLWVLPTPCTHVLQTETKGKWYGRALLRPCKNHLVNSTIQQCCPTF